MPITRAAMDELALAQREDLAADQAGRAHPAEDRQDEHQVPELDPRVVVAGGEPLADDRRQRQRGQQERDRQEEVGEERDDLVDGAAEEPGQQAERRRRAATRTSSPCRRSTARCGSRRPSRRGCPRRCGARRRTGWSLVKPAVGRADSSGRPVEPVDVLRREPGLGADAEDAADRARRRPRPGRRRGPRGRRPRRSCRAASRPRAICIGDLPAIALACLLFGSGGGASSRQMTQSLGSGGLCRHAHPIVLRGCPGALPGPVPARAPRTGLYVTRDRTDDHLRVTIWSRPVGGPAGPGSGSRQAPSWTGFASTPASLRCSGVIGAGARRSAGRSRRRTSGRR